MSNAERYVKGQLILYKPPRHIRKRPIPIGFYIIVHYMYGEIYLCPLTKENTLALGEDGNYIIRVFKRVKSPDITASSINFKIEENLIPKQLKTYIHENS